MYSKLLILLFNSAPNKLLFTGLDTLKGQKSNFIIVNCETFRNYFISLPAYSLIIWVMRSPKNFETIVILKI